MAGKEWDVSQECPALLGSRYIVLVFPHFLPEMQNPIFIVGIYNKEGVCLWKKKALGFARCWRKCWKTRKYPRKRKGK